MAQGELVLGGEVEVDAAEDLVVVRGLDELLAEVAGVVAVLLLQDAAEPLGLRLVAEVLARAAGHGEAVGRLAPLQVRVQEEERLVLADGPAQAGPEHVVVEGAELAVVGAVAHEVLVAREPVHRARELVAAAPGDGVHAPAREAALPHVVGRDQELDLLDRVQGDGLGVGLAAGGARGGDPEEVVVHRPVDLEVVVAVVAAGHRDPVGQGPADGDGREVRVEAREVVETAADGGQVLDGLLRDVGGRARVRGVEHGGRVRGDLHRLRHGLEGHPEGERPLLAQPDGHVGLGHGLEAAQGGRHRVGTAHPDVEDHEAAVAARHRRVARLGGLVHGLHRRAGQDAAALVLDQAAERARRDLGPGRRPRQEQSERGREAEERSERTEGILVAHVITPPVGASAYARCAVCRGGAQGIESGAILFPAASACQPQDPGAK